MLQSQWKRCIIEMSTVSRNIVLTSRVLHFCRLSKLTFWHREISKVGGAAVPAVLVVVAPMRVRAWKFMHVLLIVLNFSHYALTFSTSDMKLRSQLNHHQSIFRTQWSELRKVLFLAPSLSGSLVWLPNISGFGNRWTDLRQIHTEDVFCPSLGWVWRSRSKVTSDKKRHFRPFRRPACGLCLAKTSLASSLNIF